MSEDKTQHFSVRCRDVLTTARQHGRIVTAIKAVDVRYSSKGRPDSEDRKGPIISKKSQTHMRLEILFLFTVFFKGCRKDCDETQAKLVGGRLNKQVRLLLVPAAAASLFWKTTQSI